MKEFFEDNWYYIALLIMLIFAFIIYIRNIDYKNEQRLAIINNKKENVIKYENCEKIEEYYYCWKEKKEKENE